MRFSEFQVKPFTFIDFGERWLFEMHAQSKFENPQLFENADIDAQNEFAEFTKLYINDPAELTVDSEYYVFSLRCRPMVKELKVEYASHPVIYVGLSDNCYYFKHRESEFRVPVHLVNDVGYGPAMITTILYATARESNEFLSMLGLKFSGRWNVSKEELKI